MADIEDQEECSSFPLIIFPCVSLANPQGFLNVGVADSVGANASHSPGARQQIALVHLVIPIVRPREFLEFMADLLQFFCIVPEALHECLHRPDRALHHFTKMRQRERADLHDTALEERRAETLFKSFRHDRYRAPLPRR